MLYSHADMCRQSEGYTYLDKSGLCIRYNHDRLIHDDAVDVCHVEGAELARLDSEIKNEDVTEFMKGILRPGHIIFYYLIFRFFHF